MFLFNVTVTLSDGSVSHHITNAVSSTAAWSKAMESEDVVRVDVQRVQSTADYWDVQ